MSKLWRRTIVLFVIAFACWYVGLVITPSDFEVIIVISAVTTSILCVCSFAIAIMKQIKPDASKYKIFAWTDGLIGIGVIAYAVYDIMTSTGWFAGLLGMLLLMFVIPIKVKWMGVVYGVMMLWYFLTWGTFARFAIAASLLNFLVFFLGTKSWMHLSPKQMKRRAQFKQQVKQNPNPGITRHKCAICGRTEQDDPSLEFRFCSKCNGNYEFCQYHLFTHEHFK